MELNLNGRRTELADGMTVAELVDQRVDAHLREHGIAVARNGEVVPRSAWASTVLAGDDGVEVLAAVAGG